ncbi:MAG: glycosyltransferase [Lachnospiraceae bacterium]|nr:glycosyltransferase [Lachnospiraceae bacterium]
MISNEHTKKENPIVSIIMPVYNAQEFLSEAIESVLNQTFTDWEMIIVDEPTTTDSTDDIIRHYMESDERIRLIINEEKLGISKSLNVALDASRGTYIVRMDADDISLPNRLEEQVKYMERNPDVGISGCDYDVMGENWKSNLLINDEDIKSDLLFLFR